MKTFDTGASNADQRMGRHTPCAGVWTLVNSIKRIMSAYFYDGSMREFNSSTFFSIQVISLLKYHVVNCMVGPTQIWHIFVLTSPPSKRNIWGPKPALVANEEAMVNRKTRSHAQYNIPHPQIIP